MGFYVVQDTTQNPSTFVPTEELLTKWANGSFAGSNFSIYLVQRFTIPATETPFEDTIGGVSTIAVIIFFAGVAVIIILFFIIKGRKKLVLHGFEFLDLKIQSCKCLLLLD